MHPLQQFVEAAKAAIQGLAADVDAPSSPDGHWFVDLRVGEGRPVVVDHRGGASVATFGISFREDSVYGEGPDETCADVATTVARVREIFAARGTSWRTST